MGIKDEIVSQIDLYYGDKVFLLLAIISFIYLMVNNKSNRKKFLYPIVFIVLCVINPILYKLVFSKYVFWRFLWLFPDAIIIAYAMTDVIKRLSKKKVLTISVSVVCLLVIVGAGKNVYSNSSYTKVENWYKLPDEVIEVCDIILEADSEPRCVMPSGLYVYVRQYSNDIKLMYGRNFEGYISGIPNKYWYHALEMADENADDWYIFTRAYEYGYEWVVIGNNVVCEDNVPENAGYKLIYSTANYRIYFCEELNETE